MSKLYFKYGAMGGGKSLDLIRTFFNYEEKDLKAVCYKSHIHTRDGSNKIVSRTGDEISCLEIMPTDSIEELFEKHKNDGTDVILIDEVHFLKEKQIDDIKHFVLETEMPVLCYGLKTNFKSYLFEGSKRLIELADKQDEIKSICWCGKKATQNARLVDGRVVNDGQEILIGGNESYIPLCYKHYYEGKTSKKDS